MKNRLLRTIQPLASSIPLRWLVALTGQRLFLPFYHSVQKDEALPHIQHLYDLRSLADFEKDLDFLLTYYEPIDLSGLFKQLQSGEPFKKNTFFLSFDDGLQEVHEHIAPLLLKKGVPATFFLNTAFVDNQDLFFRYKASLIIDQVKNKRIGEAELKEMQQLLSTHQLSEAILHISYQNKALFDQLANYAKINFQDFLKKTKPYLSVSQIQDLIQKGFTFGSHSVDHPLYNSLSLTEQIQQTKDSQQFVNQHFNPAIKAFAFPFTDDQVSKTFFETIQQEQIIDVSFGTAGLKQDAVPFHLQRFPVEAFPFQMHNLVSSEYFYYFGKSLLGKNKIDRT